MKTVFWLRVLVLVAAAIATYAIFFGCNSSGPSWWRYVPWFGLGLHGTLLLLLSKPSWQRIVPFCAVVGVSANAALLAAPSYYGIFCGKCWLHFAILAFIAGISLLTFRPRCRPWERAASYIVPIGLVIVCWSPPHREQLAKLVRWSPRLAKIEIAVDPTKDIPEIPQKWRVFKAPAVVGFLGNCTSCRKEYVAFAKKKRVPFVAVFDATNEEIQKQLGSTSQTVTDKGRRFAKAMNAPDIRMFAVDQNYRVIWAQPRQLLGYDWEASVIILAWSKLSEWEIK